MLRGMQDETVDSVITDPPYGIRYKSPQGKRILNDERPFIWWLYDAFRVTKEGGALLCFCRWDVQEAFKWAIGTAGFRIRSQLVWDRQHHGMGDIRSAFAPCHDVIWFATKGSFFFPGARPKSVISVPRCLGRLVHSNQKPIQLISSLVGYVTPPGGLVLDPFMGSGTGGIACKCCGYRYIGVEKDRDHFEIAQKRIILTRSNGNKSPRDPNAANLRGRRRINKV